MELPDDVVVYYHGTEKFLYFLHPLYGGGALGTPVKGTGDVAIVGEIDNPDKRTLLVEMAEGGVMLMQDVDRIEGYDVRAHEMLVLGWTENFGQLGMAEVKLGISDPESIYKLLEAIGIEDE